jgi:hypothetical protein
METEKVVCINDFEYKDEFIHRIFTKGEVYDVRRDCILIDPYIPATRACISLFGYDVFRIRFDITNNWYYVGGHFETLEQYRIDKLKQLING